MKKRILTISKSLSWRTRVRQAKANAIEVKGRKTFCVTILIALLFAVSAATVSVPFGTGAVANAQELSDNNLIINGGFEAAGNWVFEGAAGRDEGVAGANSGDSMGWVFANDQSGNECISAAKQNVAVKPNTGYIATAYVKAWGNPAQAYIGFNSAQGAYIHMDDRGNSIPTTQYVKISVCINSKSANEIQLFIGSRGVAGREFSGLWIDDVTMTEIETYEDNLLTNFSFENSGTGWTKVGSGISGFDQNHEFSSYSGKGLTYIFNSLAFQGYYQTVQVDANTEYLFSGFVKRFGYVGATFEIKVTDNTGATEIASREYNDEITKGYEKFTLNFSSGSHTQIRVYFGLKGRAEDGAQGVHVDDVCLREYKASDISYDKISSLLVNEQHTLNVKIKFADGALTDPESITIESSNTDIATVTAGKITAVAAGSCTITITADGITKTFTLTVRGRKSLSAETGISGEVEGLAKISAMSAGATHTLYLTTDGKVFAKGGNLHGQLGLGNTSSQQTPKQITALSGIVSVSAGASHSLALDSEGNVYAWGSNQYGQCGIFGSLGNILTPVKIAELTDITDVSAGGYHSGVIDVYGACFTFGRNDNGQLGNGSTAPGAFAYAKQRLNGVYDKIACGTEISVLSTDDNKVFVFGGSKLSPTEILAENHAFTAIEALAAGAQSVYVLENGTIYAAGSNSHGQLGLPDDVKSTSTLKPVTFAEGIISGKITAISAFGSHATALTSDKEVIAWGNNSLGQLVAGGDSVVSAAKIGSDAVLAGAGAETVELVYTAITNEQPPKTSGCKSKAAAAGILFAGMFVLLIKRIKNV